MNPIIISSKAVPTIFETSKDSVIAMDFIKNTYQPEKVIDPVKSTECKNVVDQTSQFQTTSDQVESVYLGTIFHRNEELNKANDLAFYDMNMDQLLRIPVRLNDLCRICGQLNIDGIDIFASRGIELRLEEKIGLHMPISFDPDDLMPQKICSECCNKLEATHSLVVTCLQTDLRLRKFLNISSKAGYHPKYMDLVATCTMTVANEMSVEKVDDNDDPLNNSVEIEKVLNANNFNCKWKNNPLNIESEQQVAMCPTIVSSDDNASNMKYAVHADFNRLLQIPRDTSPKSDDQNDESSAVITTTAEIPETYRYLACSNCNNVFATSELLERHGCNSETMGKFVHKSEFELNIICPVCKLSFVDENVYTAHKSSCMTRSKKLNLRNSDKFANDKAHHDNNEGMKSNIEKSHLIVTNRRCGYCSSLFKNRKKLQDHIIDCHDGQMLFKCGICEKTYEKWSSLDVHEATHRIDRPYLCDLCGKSFKHSNNLRGHKRVHMEESKKKRHPCDICGNAFRSGFHLREHMNQHNDNKPYACEHCDKAFSKRVQLRQHRLSHGLKKHACPICGVTFNRQSNMQSHLKIHNKNEGTQQPRGIYTCSVCEYKCPTMRDLKIHRNQHTESDITARIKAGNKTIWQCKTCSKIFSKRGILVNHERIHAPDRKTVECDTCGKKLANKNSLRYHNKSLHSTDRPHICQYCGQCFVSKDSRLIHERIHTGERPYVCKFCKMEYRCSSHLTQHLKTHSSFKPHACQYCNKAFTRKGALNVHVRIHTGSKPFACGTCGRSFAQKNDMKKHTNTHRPRTVNCVKCNDTFKTKSELLKHLSTHGPQSRVEDSSVPQYAMISHPVTSYDVATGSTIVQDTVQLQIVRLQ